MRLAIIAHYLGEHRDELPVDAKSLRAYILRLARDAGFSLPDSEIKRLVREFEKPRKQPENSTAADETHKEP